MTMTTVRSPSRASCCRTLRCRIRRHIRVRCNSPRLILRSIQFPIGCFDRVTRHSCHAHPRPPDALLPVPCLPHLCLPQDMSCAARHKTHCMARYHTPSAFETTVPASCGCSHLPIRRTDHDETDLLLLRDPPPLAIYEPRGGASPCLGHV